MNVTLNPDGLPFARDEFRATAAMLRFVASNLTNVATLARGNGDGAIGRGARRAAGSLGRSATAMDELAHAMDEQATAKA